MRWIREVNAAWGGALIGFWLAWPAPVTARAEAGLGGTNAPSVILAVEGSVEVTRAGSREWLAARTNQTLGFGQSLRTGERSRATIRLSDLSVLRVNELTTVELLSARRPGATHFLDFKSGSAYFFNRTKPMDTQFRTPLVVGAIRGTEFNLEVGAAGRTVVSLLDGEVGLDNELGSVTLVSGEQGTVEPGQVPRKTAMLEAANVIQWNLYYPAVLDLNELELAPAVRTELADSLLKYRQGDLLGALAAYPSHRTPASDAERIQFAALVLAVGQVAEAEQQLGALRTRSPLAEALRAVVLTVKSKPSALISVPETATEWLAHSYQEQSQSHLEAALGAAQQAVQKSPDFGFGCVRVGELEFSLGHTGKAKRALEKGLALSPRNAQAFALQGFLLAAEGHITEATAAFEHAIQLDGALGNAWLGRGLCRFRQGRKEEGRLDLQVAAALEPNRSELRSYLGKAWYEIHDAGRARKELRLAKELDSKDPTPWLYSALMEGQYNRVNAAIDDLERAKELNQNRSVYRSQLLLDQDQAVRSANLAMLYRDDGMFDVSVREATRAVDADYANYSAHLFLAESYDALRDPKQINLRYETPWFSELLVANLLAPAGAGALSQNISQQDYARLFEGNHLGFSSDTEYFSHGDWVQHASQYGTMGNSSYALDADYRSERGYRPNNDLREFDFSAKFKQQLTPQDGVFLQVQYMDFDSGDVRQYYDQRFASPTLRVSETEDPNVFAGYHHEWSPGIHTLVLAGRLQDTLKLDDPAASVVITTKSFTTGLIRRVDQRPALFDYESDLTAYSGEVQQIFQTEHQTLIFGARVQDGSLDTHSLLFRSRTNDQAISPDLERATGYAYYSLNVWDPLQLTAGVSYDHLEYPNNNDIPPVNSGETQTDRWSPKAGFRFTPLADTTLRGVYTRSLGGVFYDTSVRLEPTQVAGFNQAFRSVLPESVAGLVPGTRFETWGLALDQKFKTRTYITVSGEVLDSLGSRDVGTLDAFGPLLLDVPASVRETLDYEEQSLTVTLNQLLGEQVAVGASYRLTHGDLQDSVPSVPQQFSGNFSATANRDVSATLHQVHAYALFNHGCGWFARAEAVWSSQSNDGYGVPLPGDNFWQFNLFAGYRFPRRQAEVQLGLLNITDQDYHLNPLTLYTELPRQRTLVASLKLNF